MHSLSVLWVSDHPLATSGYANQTRLAVTRLHRAGLCRIAVLAAYGQVGWTGELEGVPVFPGGADPFGNDVIAATARRWGADVVVTLKDVGVYQPERWAQAVRWAPLAPIDHEPPPPGVIERLRQAWQPIAYAPNGVRAMQDAGLDPLYAPHAYDPQVFYPGDKRAARSALGLPPDAYLVGTVAVNRGGLPSRKAWPQLIEAVALAARHCPDLHWLCHTDPADDGFEQGIPLRPLLAQAGLSHRVSLPHAEQYRAGYTLDHLRLLYQSLDVLLAVSVGEGFGLPTLEAQACGRPVIVGRWAAQEDLCAAGWQVERHEATRYLDAQMSYVYLPDPKAVADRIVAAHGTRDPERAGALERQAVEGVRMYAIDEVIDRHWRPVIETMRRRIEREQTHAPGVRQIIVPKMVLPWR